MRFDGCTSHRFLVHHGQHIFLSELVVARWLHRSDVSLAAILQKKKHVPFAGNPTKSAYMWRGRPGDWSSEIDGLAETLPQRLPSGPYSPLHAAAAYQLRRRHKTTISLVERRSSTIR